MIFIKGVHVRPGYQRAAAGVVGFILAGGAIGAVALHPKHTIAAPAAETPPVMFESSPAADTMPRPEWITGSDSRYLSLSARVRYESVVTSAAKFKLIQYTVQRGDSYWSIAADNNTDTSTLMNLNPRISANGLQPGQTLLVAPNFHGSGYTVRPGDTLSDLATAFGTSVEEIRHGNGLTGESVIRADDRLLIPGTRPRNAVVSRGDFVRSASPVPTASAPAKIRAAATEAGWVWPITGGLITTEYSGGHAGIDIAVPQGTKAVAARAGTVIFAGWSGGYGYCVILDHGNGYKTRYAHASAIMVRTGAKVAQGDAVILVGSTGNSTGPHLHLEFSVNGTTRNPRSFLP